MRVEKTNRNGRRQKYLIILNILQDVSDCALGIDYSFAEKLAAGELGWLARLYGQSGKCNADNGWVGTHTDPQGLSHTNALDDESRYRV